eukprot:CAMPEP_0116841640 /NCGR_PEP_ID=MMETSP0418-20121206/11052_1 /TAXON_ID=1158023 /ORGANISM="Astrosyne radiata, Strain 13vi08-1A" /LENGTH=213 /DNA_ID=CAMNT_0004472119 /DNA_START=133 /DNA_END=774 /DNA_ORIENTATION=-
MDTTTREDPVDTPTTTNKTTTTFPMENETNTTTSSSSSSSKDSWNASSTNKVDNTSEKDAPELPLDPNKPSDRRRFSSSRMSHTSKNILKIMSEHFSWVKRGKHEHGESIMKDEEENDFHEKQTATTPVAATSRRQNHYDDDNDESENDDEDETTTATTAAAELIVDWPSCNEEDDDDQQQDYPQRMKKPYWKEDEVTDTGTAIMLIGASLAM